MFYIQGFGIRCTNFIFFLHWTGYIYSCHMIYPNLSLALARLYTISILALTLCPVLL